MIACQLVKCFALAVSLIGSVPRRASASPTMFVKEERIGSWERDLTLVPNATQEGGVSIDSINAFLKDRLASRAVQSPAADFTPVCLMNFAHPQDVVSSDRNTQGEIRADLEKYPQTFSETWQTAGEELLVRVGIFEDCKSDQASTDHPLPFMAVVITDSSNSIREFDALDWSFIRLYKRSDGVINVLGCFACGEVLEIHYNPGDKDFYFKWIGH